MQHVPHTQSNDGREEAYEKPRLLQLSVDETMAGVLGRREVDPVGRTGDAISTS